MEITERFLNDTLEVRIKGTLGDGIGPACERVIRHAHAVSAQRIVFNLKEVTAIDGLGLGVLCFTLHTLHQVNTEWSLIDPPSSLKELITESGLTPETRTNRTNRSASTSPEFNPLAPPS